MIFFKLNDRLVESRNFLCFRLINRRSKPAAQNRRFINCCNRRPIVVVSKNASIGKPIAVFYNRRYRLGLSFFFFFFFTLIFESTLSWHFKSARIGLLISLMGDTYPDAFGNASKGLSYSLMIETYPNAFGSVGIGSTYINASKALE